MIGIANLISGLLRGRELRRLTKAREQLDLLKRAGGSFIEGEYEVVSDSRATDQKSHEPSHSSPSVPEKST